jgi:hypothetical protein
MFAASVLSSHLGDVIFAFAKPLQVLDITAREKKYIIKIRVEEEYLIDIGKEKKMNLL